MYIVQSKYVYNGNTIFSTKDFQTFYIFFFNFLLYMLTNKHC